MSGSRPGCNPDSINCGGNVSSPLVNDGERVVSPAAGVASRVIDGSPANRLAIESHSCNFIGVTRSGPQGVVHLGGWPSQADVAKHGAKALKFAGAERSLSGPEQIGLDGSAL